MKANIGCMERGFRIFIGAVLVVLTYSGKLNAWGWLGLIPLITGLIRYCPLYSLIGKSGCCGNSNCRNSK